MKNIKKMVVPLISVIIVAFYAVSLLTDMGCPQFIAAENIQQLENLRYGIVYFGRPTCVSCNDVKDIIESVAENTKVKTLYFNSDYFRAESDLSEEELQNIFAKFSVNDVPMLTAVFQGKIVAAYAFDDTADISLTGNEISDFYTKASKYLTWKNPYDIADLILLAASLILFNLSFCKVHKKDTSGFMLLICGIGLTIAVILSYTMSMQYIDIMGRSGNMLYGSMNIASLILCLVSVFRIFTGIFKKA